MLDKEKLLEKLKEQIDYANTEKAEYQLIEDTRMFDYSDGAVVVLTILEEAIKEGIFDKKS